MKKEIIINATSSEIRVAITEDDRLAEIFLEVPDKERHVGSIYLGRVERVVQGMNAAFIDIGEAQDAFLHFSDVGSALDEFKDLLDDKDDEEDDDEEKEKEAPKSEKVAEGKDRRNDRGRKEDTRREEKGKPAEDRPEGREARPEGRDSRGEGRNARTAEGRREGRQEGRREERQERPDNREREGRREERPESREREGRRDDRREGRNGRTTEGRRDDRQERADNREPNAEEGVREDAPQETESRRDGRRRDDRRRNDRDRRNRPEEGREQPDALPPAPQPEPETEDYEDDSSEYADFPETEGTDEGIEGGEGTEGEENGGRRRRRKRGRRGGRGRNRRRNSDQAEGDEQPEGSEQLDIAGNNKELPALETPRAERNDRRREERSERRPDNREERPAGEQDRDRGERDRHQERNRDRQRQPERSERQPQQERDQRAGNDRPQGNETSDQAAPPSRNDRDRGDRRDRHGRDRRRGNRWEERRETEPQEPGLPSREPSGRSEEQRAQEPDARRNERGDRRNEARVEHDPRQENAERGMPQERREERRGVDERREPAQGERRQKREEDRPVAPGRESQPESRADRSQGIAEPQGSYERGDNRRAPRPERPAPAAQSADLPLPVTAPPPVPQEGGQEKPEAPARAPRRTSRAKKTTPEAGEAAGAQPEAPAEATAKPTRRGARSEKPSDPPAETSGEAEAPRPKRARPSRAKRPRSGDDDAPVKGSTVDAKLPTFQTKRSGEVTIALEKGQDVIVQVTRESYASKGVRVTTKVSLPGRFLVLLPLDPAIGISRKVQNMKERRRLRRIAKSILPEGHGCIIRTVAQDKDEEVIKQDLMKLIENWREIEQKIKVREQPGLLYKDQSIANTVMRDLFTPDTNRVVIDNKALYKEIRDYVEWAAPQLVNKVELYTGQQPIFDKCGVEKELQRISERKIYIPSGGYIILDQTEAMMVIDVNSGRYAGKKDQELNSLRTNLESAREIARQIRLRDIGGLIVVDFIDLYDEKNRKKVYDELKKEMKKDRAKSVVLPMTQFGLVQMTRQRIRQQVVQTISEPCPICSGSGLVQSKSTVVRNIERWIQRFKEGSREFRLTLSANPSIIDYLTEGEMSRLTKMMLKYFVRIKVVPDDSLPVEEFHFYSLRSQNDITDKFADDNGNGSKKKAKKSEELAA